MYLILWYSINFEFWLARFQEMVLPQLLIVTMGLFSESPQETTHYTAVTSNARYNFRN